MKPKDFFLVGVKLLGVWLLLGAVDELRMALEIRTGLVEGLHTPLGVYWVHAGTNLVVAMYLLSGAPMVTAWAFGRRDEAMSDPAQ